MIIQKSEYGMQGVRTAASRRTTASASSVGGVYTGIGGQSVGAARSFGMGSNRAFSKGFSMVQYTGEDVKLMNTPAGETDEPDFLKTLNYELGSRRGDKSEDTKTTEAATGNMSISDSFNELSLRIRFQTLSFLFKLLYGKLIGGESLDLETELDNYIAQNTGMRSIYSLSSTYEEYEETSFKTQGKVVTADGRELDFGIDVTMSRSFMEQSNIRMQNITSPLLDPLVIQLDGNVDAVSDQKFMFDLDSDGKEDEISRLNSGYGFLALDKNENGSIDDGSELFGTKSGHGFAELAEYDLDKNGWIDEADEIYDKLRIWCVNEDGSRSLYKLKEKDIGALCLHCVGTEYSVKDGANRTNAVVRESGFYLKEDGTPFMMQQLDMAM